MLWRGFLVSVLGIALLPAQLADSLAAKQSHSTIKRIAAPFMRTFGSAVAPSGYQELCLRSPNTCSYGSGRERKELNVAAWNELVEVNQQVNDEIVARSDADIYGRVEYWSLPNTSGDCEDFALLKRKLLIERGWTAGSLLMTVVRDEAGEGHAVLTVRTSKGDYLLDNRRDEVLLWNEVPYTFVKRQSYLDPLAWMSLQAQPVETRAAVATAGNDDWLPQVPK